MRSVQKEPINILLSLGYRVRVHTEDRTDTQKPTGRHIFRETGAIIDSGLVILIKVRKRV